MAPSVRDAAVRYSSLGISVIPVKADKKPFTHTVRGRLLPGGSWKFAQTAIAESDMIDGWYRQAPGAGVAIVCGRVSGNLVVLDVDHAGFCEWLKVNAPKVLSSTWTVQTGSGKLHIYLRSAETCYTTVYRIDGEKLADLRADGTPPFESSYVVAPPSSYDFKGKRGHYETLYGEPDNIKQVDNAAEWFRLMVERTYRLYTGSSNGLMVKASDETEQFTMAIKAPGDTTSLWSVIKDSGVSSRVRRAIKEGVESPGEGEWRGCPSNSDVDFAVVIEMRERGMSPETIEDVFASFPIGAKCYQNVKRPHHGERYIRTTIGKADKKIEAKKQAAMSASGKNFEITRVVRVDYEDPVYELYALNDSGESGKICVSATELTSERLFKVASVRDMNFLPVLKDAHAKNFDLFASSLMMMATVEEPPEDATDMGHLSGLVMQVLKHELNPVPPDDVSEVLLGWRDDSQDMAFVRGQSLIQRIGQTVRPTPGTNKIWEVLRGVGATDGVVRMGKGTTRVWKLPLAVVDR